MCIERYSYRLYDYGNSGVMATLKEVLHALGYHVNAVIKNTQLSLECGYIAAKLLSVMQSTSKPLSEHAATELQEKVCHPDSIKKLNNYLANCGSTCITNPMISNWIEVLDVGNLINLFLGASADDDDDKSDVNMYGLDKLLFVGNMVELTEHLAGRTQPANGHIAKGSCLI